ncbi:MAG: SUMF1/EgtB/PvdO family nonheme iron enzyme [Chloroflexi bacterium]|nr:SUMF1/EgtB/PvdO family nonheme iron enzyme [Chloroflexota bacterium]
MGCEEMGGNVFEWTRSIWGKNWDSKKQKYEQEYGYPYQPEDGRENLAANIYNHRVMRTGVYGLESSFGRCAARYRVGPRLDGGDNGLRLVVVPIQRSAL